jgi:hypothetical protein
LIFRQEIIAFKACIIYYNPIFDRRVIDGIKH